MFPEDVKRRLDRLNFLESEKLAICKANSNAVLAEVRARIEQKRPDPDRLAHWDNHEFYIDDILDELETIINNKK
jgi:hypothetical protein